ncbi:cyclic nucleotide-binding/CBS domain-containing protein [Bacteriovorax sp. DB6_IX]|uniref:CBS domain-containing protein n=1 Tax=Bacteriovorax sp. DB6_IX TaxID=1353530 RepID=UPI000389F9B4|nr:CBS domain-containing protein [Bacteriovorax sp. DB6_IX]EQC52328.1 CBS domain protein [Bacteriovorax sp. DB6_IX]
MTELVELLEYTIDEIQREQPKMVMKSDPVKKALELIKENNITSCLVVNEDATLAGIITERDILKKITGQDTKLNDPIEKHMTPNPQTIKGNESIVIALAMMSHGGFRNLPVTDLSGKAIGLINMSDVMSFFTNHLRDD